MRTKNHRGGSPVATIVVLIVILGIAAYYYLVTTPQGPPRSERVRAINYGKNLFVALTGFAKDHDGLYPCEATGDAATAEECFTQLILSGDVDDEAIFWIKKNAILGTTSKSKPNNNETLETGENSWGYVKGLNLESPSSTPLIFDSATAPGQFSTAVWDGKAIVVRLNGSATVMDISGHVESKVKTGPILERRGAHKVDIFSKEALPEGTTILLPTKP